MMMRKAAVPLVLILVSLFLASVAAGETAEFFLRASASTLVMQDGTSVPMWGFSASRDSAGNELPPPSDWSPGPELRVPPTATKLVIHLVNDLAEPVSLWIPGLAPQVDVGTGEGQPVRSTWGSGVDRVRSFTHEATPGGGVATYVWNDVGPGTLLYQSGTNPAKQVQMGLYGAVRKDLAALPATSPLDATETYEAYPGITYNQDLVLLFSEVDVEMHVAIASGNYGRQADVGNGGMTSSIGYSPDHFLLNGREYDPNGTPGMIGGQGPNLLVRFLNAGYQTYVPVINDVYMEIVADDGAPLPYSRSQYSVELHAGKTHDALISMPCASEDPRLSGRILTIQDRRGHVRNRGAAAPGAPGGLTVQLAIPADGACDNCTRVDNPRQVDSDGDGFGNRCDGDLDGNLIVNFGDFALFVDAFVDQNNPAADLNSDGIVNLGDVGILSTLFYQPPGPSLAVH